MCSRAIIFLIHFNSLSCYFENGDGFYHKLVFGCFGCDDFRRCFCGSPELLVDYFVVVHLRLVVMHGTFYVDLLVMLIITLPTKAKRVLLLIGMSTICSHSCLASPTLDLVAVAAHSSGKMLTV